MVDVALVTARVAAETDRDLPPLRAALHDAGIRAEVTAWDDDGIDWSAYRLAVLRSPWDYVPRYDEFLAWLARAAAATTVLNDPAVVRWNTDKRYLRTLARAGVPVVSTRFYEPDASPPTAAGLDALAANGSEGEIVVKPVVSAGSKDTMRHSTRSGAADHARALLTAGRAVMVQPYQSAVDAEGETGLVFLDGVFSHAFRKGPILRRDAAPTDEFFAPEEITARIPTAAQRSVADAALAAAPAALLYARVDVIPDPAGAPQVLELELAEPSFFFDVAPESAARFAECIGRRLDRATPDRSSGPDVSSTA